MHTDYSLLDFLSRPESYPHRPGRVEHIQTHISHVFMASPYVFKIKKPVNFGFLDYSTLEKRKHFCEQEIMLNRRLCDDIYLETVPIFRSGERFSFEPSDGREAVEYAVQMKELDRAGFLSEMVRHEAPPEDVLDRIADTLTRFYLRQDVTPEILEYGRPEMIRRNTGENFEQTQPFVAATIDGDSSDAVTIDRAAFDTIRKYTDHFLDRHSALFSRRVSENRIVDGHGDLHLDHIHITPSRICIYDCIEFNERFRYGDVAADLAFLAMDLDFNDCANEGRYFIRQMSRRLNDPELRALVDFYKCYRAYVKGKVKSLQSAEEEVAPADRRKAAEAARRYFDLALAYALLGSTPTVLIFMGRIGSGKSTLAEQVSRKLHIAKFASDDIRKDMAGLARYERTPESGREELYSPAMSQKVYAALLDEAERQIRRGRHVALDATFSSRRGRAEFQKELRSREMAHYFIEAQAADNTIKGRLELREYEDDVVSDARLEDFDHLNSSYDPPDELDSRHVIRVDTNGPVEESLAQVYSGLVDVE